MPKLLLLPLAILQPVFGLHNADERNVIKTWQKQGSLQRNDETSIRAASHQLQFTEKPERFRSDLDGANHARDSSRTVYGRTSRVYERNDDGCTHNVQPSSLCRNVL